MQEVIESFTNSSHCCPPPPRLGFQATAGANRRDRVEMAKRGQASCWFLFLILVTCVRRKRRNLLLLQ